MPRRPNAECASCGTPGYQFPEAAVAYTCLPCRRARHGVATQYRRGCRCRPCTDAATAQVRRTVERFKAKHGIHPSVAWRRQHGSSGRGYWIPRATRRAVYERDRYTCWLCNEPTDPTADPQRDDLAPSLDHVIPWSLGGTEDPENLRTAHRVCNARRGAEEALDAP